MSAKIIHSSELMTDYIQAQVIGSEGNFEAVQSDNGHSLLFSIGSDKQFYLTEEMPGTATGWQKSKLSASLASFFPGSTFNIKRFSTSQNSNNNEFSVVVVVKSNGNDHLFIATSFSRDDKGFIVLAWKALPFDAPGITVPDIKGLYILQTAGGPLTVVNLTSNGSTTLERYYVDSEKKPGNNTLWNKYTLPVNMNADGAKICGGRKKFESVDGIYSLGKVGPKQSIYYQQLYDPFNPGRAGAASELFCEKATPAVMAVVPSASSDDDVTYTDLYVGTQEGDLYYFAYNNQKDSKNGVKIVTNELLKGATMLYAYAVKKRVVVWGLRNYENKKQVFYTQCDERRVADQKAWSLPMVIGNDVAQISPYINRVNGGNTFFAVTGVNRLKKVFQDPSTTIYTSQDILLKDEGKVDPQEFASYITTITLVDETNTPIAGEEVTIASAIHMPVYLNNKYSVLDTTATKAVTDGNGRIKISQRSGDLQAARLTVQSKLAGAPVEINPVENAFAKIQTLITPDALRKATLTDDAGKDPRKLVNANVSDADLKIAAESIKALCEAYQVYDTDGGSSSTKPKAKSTGPGITGPQTINFNFSPTARVYSFAAGNATLTAKSPGDLFKDIGNAIVVAAGDLFNMIADAVNYVVHIVVDAATAVWNFVVEVAGVVYTFVVDCIEKVVGAIVAVFEFIKTLIIDLIQFLKFLFNWDDIKVTKDVLTNLIFVYLQEGNKEMDNYRKWIDGYIVELKNDVSNWGGLPSSMPEASQPVTATQSGTNYSNAYTSPNTYLEDHLTYNMDYATYLDEGKTSYDGNVDLIMNLYYALEEAVKAEWDAMKAAGKAFDDMFGNGKYKKMSLNDILKGSLAIIANFGLDTAVVLVDALTNLLQAVFQYALDCLSRPIWIPVISYLLKKIFGYEFDFSILDVLCYVGAIPATLMYKIGHKSAPFEKDDPDVQKLLTAKSIAEISKYFGGEKPIDYSEELYSTLWLPQKIKVPLFACFHGLSGIMASVNAVAILAEGIYPLAEMPVVTPIRLTASAIQSGCYSLVGITSAPYPIQNTAVSYLSTAISTISTINFMAFAALPTFVKDPVSKETVAISGAVSDMVISLVSIAPVAFHFSELSLVKSNNNRSLAIMDETVKLCGYIASMCADFTKIDKEPVTKLAVAAVSSGLSLINSGIQIAETLMI